MTKQQHQPPTPDEQLAALTADYPRWTLIEHYVPSVSGPGTVVYMAVREGITVSAYTIGGLRAHLAEHEAGEARAAQTARVLARRPILAAVVDPVGLQRCASCGNAFEYDRQPDGTCAQCGQPFGPAGER